MNTEVDKILNCLNEKATEPSKENAEIVHQFINALTDLLNDETGILHKSDIMHSGSSYEAMVVKAESDFDLPLVLSDPFTGDNFKIIRDPITHFFQLQWKGIPPEECNKYCDGKLLNAKQLIKDIFERISVLSKRISLPGWTIKVDNGLQALGITLQSGQKKIDIDLAPQIAVREWDGCPDLQPLSCLPCKLVEHIRTLERNDSPVFFFSLAVPKSALDEPHGHQLVKESFSMLEKNFFREYCDIRDMVRLVKLVADKQHWKAKYGIKTVYIKKVAINNYLTLQWEPTKWAGFKKMLQYLKKDLVLEENIGCFMKNQEMNKLKNTEDLKNQIELAYRMNIQDLYALANEESVNLFQSSF